MSATDVMSQLTFLGKYSRFDYTKGRRESWEETVKRVADFLSKSAGGLKQDDYDLIYNAIFKMEVGPSMRLMSTAGVAADLNNASIYNCSYLPLESAQDFHDLTLLLGLGVGVGFSVEKHFVQNFGVVQNATGNTYKYQIGDDIYSWAQSVKFLVEHAIAGNNVAFDYSLIRPAGTPLRTRGGRASGPAPLMDAHGKIQELIVSRRGKPLTTIDAFDIACYIAGAIVSGGVRRSAMIAIFDKDDELMLNAKAYGWWENNLQRSYANISVVIDEYLFEEDVDALLQRQHDSKSGEPGIFSRYAVRASMPKRRKLVANMGTNPSL